MFSVHLPFVQNLHIFIVYVDTDCTLWVNAYRTRMCERTKNDIIMAEQKKRAAPRILLLSCEDSYDCSAPKVKRKKIQ